jgi:hypothetical protein
MKRKVLRIVLDVNEDNTLLTLQNYGFTNQYELMGILESIIQDLLNDSEKKTRDFRRHVKPLISKR